MHRPLTESEMSAWRRCQRQWWLRYHLGYQPLREDTTTPTAPLGSLVHRGLEAWALAGSPEDPARALEAVDEYDSKDHALVQDMLIGYVEWAHAEGLAAGACSVSTEAVIRAPGPLGVELLGKADQVRVRPDGGISLLDYKTVTSLASFELEARTRQQYRTYALIMRLSGKPVQSVEVIGLRRSRRTARSTPPYYQRTTVTHPDAVLRAHWHHISLLIRDMRAACDYLERTDHAQDGLPPSVTRDCQWQCPFKAPCAALDYDEDYMTILDTDYIVTDPLERYRGND